MIGTTSDDRLIIIDIAKLTSFKLLKTMIQFLAFNKILLCNKSYNIGINLLITINSPANENAKLNANSAGLLLAMIPEIPIYRKRIPITTNKAPPILAPIICFLLISTKVPLLNTANGL